MFKGVVRGRMSDEMTAILARITMSQSKRENMNIAGEFGKLIERMIEQEETAAGLSSPDKAISSTIKFKADECRGMDKAFKKEFAAAGYVARVIKRPSAKKRVRTYVYEIRYRRNGYKVEVSATDINEAKRKFIVAASPENIEDHAQKGLKSGFNLFREVAAEWFEYKRGKVTEKTLNDYRGYYRRHLHTTLGEMPIKAIRTIDVDKALKGQKPRVYEELRTICNSVFKYAINSGIAKNNPVALIPFKAAERTTEKRRALTIEEQAQFFKQLEKPEFAKYRKAFLIMFYFGLRPCELQDVRFENGFLIARNAKRKGGKIEHKKIPVHEQARQKIDITAPIDGVHNPETLNRIFKRIMGGGELTQYSLRHTFATVCQMYVRPDIVDIWLGDSSERLVGRVYTHFPDEFMIKQMQSVKFGRVA